MQRILLIIFICFFCCFMQGCNSIYQNIYFGQREEEKTKVITDSINRQVEIPKNINRVVVTNTYNAELINDIGGLNKIVGVDYFIYQDPAGFRYKFTKDMLVGSLHGGVELRKNYRFKSRFSYFMRK